MPRKPIYSIQNMTSFPGTADKVNRSRRNEIEKENERGAHEKQKPHEIHYKIYNVSWTEELFN